MNALNFQAYSWHDLLHAQWTPPARDGDGWGFGAGWVGFGLMLALVIGVLWWIGRLSRGVQGSRGGLEVVARLGLEPRRTIYVVKLGKRGVIIGSGEGGLVALGEVPEEEMTLILEAASRPEQRGLGSEFTKRLMGFIKPPPPETKP